MRCDTVLPLFIFRNFVIILGSINCVHPTFYINSHLEAMILNKK